MSTLQIDIHDVIGSDFGVTSSRVAAVIRNAGDGVSHIEVSVNSPGGSVSAGIAIYNLLRRHAAKVIVYVDGLAASIASVIMLAGDEVVMGTGSRLMIHDPLAGILGRAKDLRKYADLLDRLKAKVVEMYVTKTGQSAEQIADWMDGETWFDADEAVDAGFANRVADDDSRAVATAKFDLSAFRNVPASLSQIGHRANWHDQIVACAGDDLQRLSEQFGDGEEQQLRAEFHAAGGEGILHCTESEYLRSASTSFSPRPKPLRPVSPSLDTGRIDAIPSKTFPFDDMRVSDSPNH